MSVIVDDGQKTSCSTGTAEILVKINTPPQAHMTVPQQYQVGKSIEFSALTSSDPDNDHLAYGWDFGDGTQGEGEVISHVYAQRGSYQVRLTVDDDSETPCSQGQENIILDVRSAPVAVMNIR